MQRTNRNGMSTNVHQMEQWMECNTDAEKRRLVANNLRLCLEGLIGCTPCRRCGMPHKLYRLCNSNDNKLRMLAQSLSVSISVVGAHRQRGSRVAHLTQPG